MEAFGPEVVAFVQQNPELTIFFTLALVMRRMFPYLERAFVRFAGFYCVVLDSIEKMAERTVTFVEKLRRLWKRAWAEPKQTTKTQALSGPVAVLDVKQDAA